MAVELVLRNGTAAENDSFTGALAEVTVDNTNKTLRVHDGATSGGNPLLTASGTATLLNKTLEDPTFTGQITGDLIPSSDVAFDLGAPTNRWNDLYLSGSTIDIGGATISVVGGSFEFKDSTGNSAEVSLAANTTDDLAEGTTNLYYLDSRVDSHLSGGTGVAYSSGTISIGQSVGTTDNVTFNDVTVDGDLIVNGSSTTLNTTTLDVEDLNITVASGATDSSSADGAGFTVDGANATLTYSNSSDRFVFNKDIEADTLVGQVSDISNHNTDDLTEGSANLYYTDARARDAVSAATGIDYDSATGVFNLSDTSVTAGSFGSASEVPVISIDEQGRITSATTTNVAGVSSFSYNGVTGDLDIGTADGSTFTATVDLGPFTTNDLTEGTNLYYTDARVNAYLNGGSGIDFSNGTISHSDTSGVGNVTATSNTFVDSLTFDEFGHVTAVSTSTAAPPNDATITVSAGTGLNGGGNFTTDQSGNETISLDVDTSTIATRTYVDTEVSNLVDSSPQTLDTLNELAAALGDDPNFATTVSNQIGNKADKAINVSAGSGLTGGGDLSANRTIGHADTSSQGDVNNSGGTVIQDINVDTYGHITSIGSKSLSASDVGALSSSGKAADSNLLDGINSSQFLRSDTSDTMNGQLNMSNNRITNVEDLFIRDKIYHDGDTNTYIQFASDRIEFDTGGSERMEINDSGIEMRRRVDMNNNDIRGVDQIFHHGDTNTYMQFHSSDQWRVVTGGSERLEVNNTRVKVSGDFAATDDIVSHFSDDRLKTKLGVIDKAVDKVNSIEGFYYEPNDTAISLGYNQEQLVGVSAQDVQSVLPEVVKKSPISDDYLTVQYEKMVPLLIEAIKEQSSTIEDLKRRINTLENR